MLFFSSEPTKGINSRLLTAFRMKTAIVVGAFLGKFLQSDPFVKKEIADSSPLRVRLKIKFSVWEVSQTFFFNIWEISAENNRRGEETRCDSVARGLVFTGTWCSAPAMLRCTAFSLPAPLWWKKKTSAGERERQPIERDPEVHTTSVTSPKHQATGRQRERRRNGRKPREGEADRHRVMTVMSKWSDTGERGETNRDGQRDRQSEDAERGNLRETCHNNVTSGKNGDAAAPRVQYRNVDGRPERFRWKYPCMSTQIKSRQRKIATWLED